MKTKNLVLSLIFPIICFSFSVIPTLLSFEIAAVSDRLALYITTGSFGALAGLFPLIAVIFGKTDISPAVKWQLMFTALAAVSIIIITVLSGFINNFPYFLNVFFMIIAPLGSMIAAGIIFGKIFRSENAAILKWFAAFLSTPILWYFLFLLIIATAIGEKPFELSYSHVG